MSPLSQIKLAEAAPQSVQIFTKHNTHNAQRIFISKFEIALKEASETGYWLELLYRTKYIDEQTFKTLSSKCTSLRVMLIAACKTAKENAK